MAGLELEFELMERLVSVPPMTRGERVKFVILPHLLVGRGGGSLLSPCPPIRREGASEHGPRGFGGGGRHPPVNNAQVVAAAAQTAG